MAEMVMTYDPLSLSQQVIERQRLAAAFQDAQRRGVPVTTTPGEKP